MCSSNSSSHCIAEAIADHIIELSQTRLAEMIAAYKTLKRANTSELAKAIR